MILGGPKFIERSRGGKVQARVVKMKTLLFFLIFLHLLGTSSTVYKQWIPNTNFENASNWDRGQVPCAKDVVLFGRSEVVSVFVQSPHTLTEMHIPLNGEFIMAPGAAFTAFDGNQDPGCETGSEVTFASTGNYQWYDPTLWHAASSLENLERGKYTFSVDEERVPCQYDDVLFQPETSFRVDIESSEQMIQLRSISIMGQRPSAKLQFQGQATFRLSNARCPDKTGCECGNTGDHHRICAALLQSSENQCPVPTCKDPLRPIGHCCEICGAIVSLDYSAGFDMELYQARIVHTFLSLSKNAGIQMAMSKVHKPQTFLGIGSRSTVPFIQIVLIDNGTGVQIGTRAEQLAKDIMSDVAEHGESFGIVTGHLQSATGSNWSAQGAGSSVGAAVAGPVLGLLLVLLILGIVLLLYRKEALRSIPSMSFSSLWKRKEDPESFQDTSDKGFENPMFDTPSNPAALAGACSMEETPTEKPSKSSRLYYINPLYDETELNA